MSQMTVAISEQAAQSLFLHTVKNFRFEKSFPPKPNIGCDIACTLEGGTFEMRDDNAIRIRELDVKWDKLAVHVAFDIREMCVGGGCIPIPFTDDVLCTSRYCIFSDNPDIAFTLDLSGWIRSEASLIAGPEIAYHVNADPGRDPSWSAWEAEEYGWPNTWQVYFNIKHLAVDPFDVADIIGDLLERAADAAIDRIFDALPGGVPQWARDLFRSRLGGTIDLVRKILDIPDDIGEWLDVTIREQLGFTVSLQTLLGEYLASHHPIEIKDPMRVLPADDKTGLVAVKAPLRGLKATINSQELILEGSVGV